MFVDTMPMLRSGELTQIVNQAEIAFALCDTRVMDELVTCANGNQYLKKVIGFDGTADHNSEMDRIALDKDVRFQAVDTGRDDVALLAFTSGTTGKPKATMHFHRDLLIIADGYAKEVLGVTPDDLFVGSPPLAFTFGLGGLAIFPLRFGATATLLETASPPNMLKIVETYKATIYFTAPTAYLAMLKAADEGADISSLRLAVSAGETLPAPVYERWSGENRQADPGWHRLDRAAAHLHHQPPERHAAGGNRPASRRLRGQGRRRRHEGGPARHHRQAGGGRHHRLPLPRRRAAEELCEGWLEPDRRQLHPGRGRRVPLRGALGRHDHLFRLSIARPEVEAALLSHPNVAECGVIGVSDAERGQIVEAHVVLAAGVEPDALTVKRLQDHVKQVIAPYKYPRSVKFVASLPKTQTGKLQRIQIERAAELGRQPTYSVILVLGTRIHEFA